MKGRILNVVCMEQQRKAVDLAAARCRGIRNKKHRLAQEGMDLEAALYKGTHSKRHRLIREGTQRPVGQPRDRSRR